MIALRRYLALLAILVLAQLPVACSEDSSNVTGNESANPSGACGEDEDEPGDVDEDDDEDDDGEEGEECDDD